jgi:hypothetical protein
MLVCHDRILSIKKQNELIIIDDFDPFQMFCYNITAAKR